MNTQRKLIAAMSLCAAFSVPNIASAAWVHPVSGYGTWETTLLARDLDGNSNTIEAYYDTTLNITWLADAVGGMGSIYDDLDSYGGTTDDGRMSWQNANAWAASLNFDGIDGWRLPNLQLAGECIPSPTGCEYSVLYNELASMYYDTLGRTARFDETGAQVENYYDYEYNQNTGPFLNLVPFFYWTSLSSANSDNAYAYIFDGGLLTEWEKSDPDLAWAVHDGDVGIAIPSAVPVPAAAWLFGSGLLGLIGVARKRTV